MLYERWRQVAREYRDSMALRDVSRGVQWTFAELAAAAEAVEAKPGKLVYPQGPRFVIELLCAWRDGQVACPLEPGQPPPRFERLPPGCVHLKTTSASTGAARVVALTAEQLSADAENITATMGLRPDWPNLGVISLAHSYGFSNLVLPLLLHGIPLIVTDAPLPEMVRQAAESAESITLPGVPALWRTWQDAGAIPKNVRLAISAGAPLSIALEKSVYESIGLKLHNFYGSSECGGIAYDDSAVPRTDASCTGRAMKNVDLSVDEDGCLKVRGKAVSETYWPERSPNLADGCFRSDDLVEIQDGQIYLRGRAGDQMNIAGRKLSPEAIEKALSSHPSVKECLVFGAPSFEAERTEIVVACVSTRTEVSGEHLKQFLLHELPAWQIPREWMFVKSLEVNQRGKLSRADWRRKFLEGKAGRGA